jgi:cytochrome c-type biogenesis protein CcmH/NrfG
MEILTNGFPGYWKGLMVLAETCRKLGDLQPAMHALETSLDINPTNVQVLVFFNFSSDKSLF